MLTREDNDLITRTGLGTPSGALWRQFWLPAMLSSELQAPDCPPVRLRLLGEDLIAFRTTDGRVGAVANNCPHRGASLFFGRNEEQGLRCVYHGWKFDLTGACLDMPNEPAESNFKSKVRVTAYPCAEKAGLVWVYMGPPEVQPKLPALEWTEVPDSHRYLAKISVESNWLQALEGDIDNSHASILHAGIGGPPDAPFAARLAAGRGARPGRKLARPGAAYYAADTAPRGIVQETDYGLMMGWQRFATEENFHWHINHWLMPSYVLLGSAPGSTVQCNARMPMDDENSWFIRVRYNPHRPLTEEELFECTREFVTYSELIPGTFRPVENADNDYLIDRAVQRTTSMTGIKSVPAQDRAVTDTMGPIYDRTKEHLGTSDTVIIAVRRHLLRMARGMLTGEAPRAAGDPDVYRIRPVDMLLNRELPWVERAQEAIRLPG
ncbi:MAG: Rieske 2Fe-2S domain-containing protein [Chloroflexota bacterium]